MKHPALNYFRFDGSGTPHLWCPGCGIGQVWYYTAKAIEELGLDTNKVLWVGGSGCTGRMCTYWYKDYFHTLHGRPLAFATGVKLARPELTVICHMGDGEAAAIGGNHLIQSARRNVELVAICINNFNYGMTGGQFSPTTPTGAVTSTSLFGNVERTFDLCRLVEVCGASYVARWTTVHVRQTIESIKKGIKKEGFSFIEVVSQCPTFYGRRNKIGDAVQMMKWFRSIAVTSKTAEKMSQGELEGKIVVGELADRESTGFCASLHDVAKRMRGGSYE